MSDIPNKIRFCCLPVLPTIFSDELSYLDVLSKMRDYINQMIEALKQQDEDIANIQKQVDKIDLSKYIPTSGGTLTGPLFFIDNAHVLKNEDGTITLSGTGQMNIHGGGNVTIDTPESIAIRADKAVDITGSTGVEILTGENGTVDIQGGAVAITGDINIYGSMKFDQGDTLDARGAGVLVDEPQIDGAPVNLKYFNEHKDSGVTCGYISVAVDDSKTTVDVHSESLIPVGKLGGYYVDNAGNLWHATQVAAGGFTLENQNINVLAHAEFVRITGNTSVKNINVNDTGSSTYQATTNVLVHGGTNVDITAGQGAVDIEGPIVDIHAAKHMNIVTDSNGDIVIGVNKNIMTLSNSNISLPSAQSGDAGIARLIDIPYNQKAQFGNFTIAAQNSIDYRVFMIANSSDAPVANVTAPVFMVFSEASLGVRDGIAVDSAGVIYKVIHNYASRSFEMAKQTPNVSGGGAAMKQFDITNGVPMIPIANIPPSGGAVFYVSFTVGDKNDNNTSFMYNGAITTYNGEVVDVRILSIGWLSSGDPVECHWVDTGSVTKTTDGITIDAVATSVGFSGWYAKID